ncbi:hypothetical protein T484DRAFT_1843493 [Baffinella frigidus]|nr:hypothetical protein T484DRAFT_1843493 [Cryptophyta sp. CCMP2293]
MLVLVSRGAAIEATDDKGNTPLLAAAATGHVVTCAALLALGAAAHVVVEHERSY